MQRDYWYYLAAAAICLAAMFHPMRTEAGSSHWGIVIQRDGDSCAALEARSDAALSRAEETFTEPKGGTLAIDGASHARIRVRGWDRPEYSVTACKLSAGGDAKAIAVHRTSGRYSASGPATGEWLVYFIVQAPAGASLDLETKNQPIDVSTVSGTVKARTANGPLSIADTTGDVQARSMNGPVAFSGGGGTVSLTTQNGPVSVKLAGSAWPGSQLEARTMNGPLSFTVPDNYHSGVRVETSGRAPVHCQSPACAGSDSAARPAIRISTEHGPVSVRSAKPAWKVI
jgi:hypothetical protein